MHVVDESFGFLAGFIQETEISRIFNVCGHPGGIDEQLPFWVNSPAFLLSFFRILYCGLDVDDQRGMASLVFYSFRGATVCGTWSGRNDKKAPRLDKPEELKSTANRGLRNLFYTFRSGALRRS